MVDQLERFANGFDLMQTMAAESSALTEMDGNGNGLRRTTEDRGRL
ncbi:hypothetical protein [Agromyces aureus]|nr:hypothetical protein [Agromyces aureus]